MVTTQFYYIRVVFIFTLSLALAHAKGQTNTSSGSAPQSQSQTGTTPQSSSTPGSDTLGATILSYESQQNIGEDIATRIVDLAPTNEPMHIYITTELQNAGGVLVQYEEAYNQLKQLQIDFNSNIRDGYNELTNPPTVPPPATKPPIYHPNIVGALAVADVVTGIVAAVNSVLADISTTTSVNGVSVTVDPMGIIPAIENNLNNSPRGTNLDATYVDLYIDTSTLDSSNSLFALINSNMVLCAQAQVITNLIITNIMSAVLAANPTSSDADYRAFLQNEETTYIKLSSLIGQFNNLYTSMLNTNILAPLLEADIFEVNVKHDTNSYLLYLKPLYAGGDDRIKSNPFVNLFTDGPRYTYSGGAVVAYMFLNSSGKTVLAATARDLTGYEKIGNGNREYMKGNLKPRP